MGVESGDPPGHGQLGEGEEEGGEQQQEGGKGGEGGVRVWHLVEIGCVRASGSHILL